MDENKIVKLDIKKQTGGEEEKKTQQKQSLFHTNPLLQKMFISNINNKKGKFSLKDLFKQ
jgi:hypothetical protein